MALFLLRKYFGVNSYFADSKVISYQLDLLKKEKRPEPLPNQ